MEEGRAHLRINQPPIKVMSSDIRTVQDLLGHRDVKTTMISTHVLNRRARWVFAARWTVFEPIQGGVFADPHKMP